MSSRELYTDKVKDHFTYPKKLGVVSAADGKGEVGNLICGDTVKMYVRLSPDKSTVADASYQTYGCVYSIACADALACMVAGKSVADAEAITDKDVIRDLDGVPSYKEHCAVMAVNALRAALNDAGRNVPLLQGMREITPDAKKAASIIPLSIQQKHRIAEMFDEFIIPELKKKGIVVELLDVDVAQHNVKFKASSSAGYAKSFSEQLLRKYIDSKLSLQS